MKLTKEKSFCGINGQVRVPLLNALAALKTQNSELKTVHFLLSECRVHLLSCTGKWCKFIEPRSKFSGFASPLIWRFLESYFVEKNLRLKITEIYIETARSLRM